MQALTSQRLAASAYRTLGLSASASQAQIDQAARRMRIWPDAKRIPPTEWDFPWLGVLHRNKNEIEQAQTLLTNPTTRIEERLIWFNGTSSNLWTSGSIRTIDKTLRSLPSTDDPALRHDIALARLQFALKEDPEFRDAERWNGLLVKLSALAESDAYLTYSISVEEKGSFEKRARREEIEQAARALPDWVAQSIAAFAASAMEDDDFAAATRVLSILRLSAPKALERCQADMAARLEDLVLRRCNHLHDDVDKIGSPTVTVKQGRVICKIQGKFYSNSILPVLELLNQIAGADAERSHRARTETARAKARLAQAWAITRELRTAEKLFVSALKLGEGTPVERPIRDNLERCRRALKKQPPGPPGTSAPVVRTGQSFIPTYVRRQKTSRTQTNGKKSMMWLVIMGAIALSRAFSSLPTSSTSSTSWQNEPGYVPRIPRQIIAPPEATYNLLNAPTVSINGGPIYTASFAGSGHYAIEGNDDHDPGGLAHQFAVVGDVFNFVVGGRFTGNSGNYLLVSGPVGIGLNMYTGEGTWTPMPGQSGRVEVEVAFNNNPRVPHLHIDFPCYAFNPPTNVSAKAYKDSKSGAGSNWSVLVGWNRPANATHVAGYKLTAATPVTTISSDFEVPGESTTANLSGLKPGQYKLWIVAYDGQGAVGLRSQPIVFDVPAQVTSTETSNTPGHLKRQFP